MIGATPPSSFLCTLAADGKDLAYHVAVSFRDGSHPVAVQFTSFVGTGRRSFAVRSAEGGAPSAIDQTGEELCRIAIGQVVRDHLYDKAADGDHVLDPAASPWQGELKPVGAGNSARLPTRRHAPG